MAQLFPCVSETRCRPSGTRSTFSLYPGLTPWANLFRRSAAEFSSRLLHCYRKKLVPTHSRSALRYSANQHAALGRRGALLAAPPRCHTGHGCYFITASTFQKRKILQSDRMAGLCLPTFSIHYRQEKRHERYLIMNQEIRSVDPQGLKPHIFGGFEGHD